MRNQVTPEGARMLDFMNRVEYVEMIAFMKEQVNEVAEEIRMAVEREPTLSDETIVTVRNLGLKKNHFEELIDRLETRNTQITQE